MEIKVNEEIRNIKETFILGLSMRQTLWSVVAIISAVLTYLALHKSISQLEFTITICMLVAAPFVCLGFLRIQGMPAEKIFVELLRSYIINHLEIYNIPRNEMLELLKEQEYNAPEAVKKRKRQQNKRILIFLICFVVFLSLCVVMAKVGQDDGFKALCITESDDLISQYDLLLYDDESQESLNDLFDSLRVDREAIEDEEALNRLLRTYKNKLNAVSTVPQEMADKLYDRYSLFTNNNPKMYGVLTEQISKIKAASTIEDAQRLYDEAVYSLNYEIAVTQ